MRGFLRLAKRFKVPLAGGDTGQSPMGVLAASLCSAAYPRAGPCCGPARNSGDSIYVTGLLGAFGGEFGKARTRWYSQP